MFTVVNLPLGLPRLLRSKNDKRYISVLLWELSKLVINCYIIIDENSAGNFKFEVIGAEFTAALML